MACAGSWTGAAADLRASGTPHAKPRVNAFGARQPRVLSPRKRGTVPRAQKVEQMLTEARLPGADLQLTVLPCTRQTFLAAATLARALTLSADAYVLIANIACSAMVGIVVDIVLLGRGASYRCSWVSTASWSTARLS